MTVLLVCCTLLGSVVAAVLFEIAEAVVRLLTWSSL